MTSQADRFEMPRCQECSKSLDVILPKPGAKVHKVPDAVYGLHYWYTSDGFQCGPESINVCAKCCEQLAVEDPFDARYNGPIKDRKQSMHRSPLGPSADKSGRIIACEMDALSERYNPTTKKWERMRSVGEPNPDFMRDLAVNDPHWVNDHMAK